MRATLTIENDSRGLLNVEVTGAVRVTRTLEGDGWKSIMTKANREVERVGYYVQGWHGGPGSFTTTLGTRPPLFD